MRTSKNLVPPLTAAAFAELARPKPRYRFTVGITDDVMHLSLEVESQFSPEPAGVVQPCTLRVTSLSTEEPRAGAGRSSRLGTP